MAGGAGCLICYGESGGLWAGNARAAPPGLGGGYFRSVASP